MQVERIVLRDWLGRSGVTELKQRNLIVGPVGSGKTAHLRALQFAATGTSILGVRPQAAIGFGSPNGCMVGVELDDGFKFHRGLGVKRSDGRVSNVSSNLVVPNANSQMHAAQLLSDHIGHFVPMFDLGVIFKLTADQQRAWIMGLCAAAQGAEPTESMIARMRFEWYRQRLGRTAVDVALQARAKPGDDAPAMHALSEQVGVPELHALAASLEHVRKAMKEQIDVVAAIGAALVAAKDLASRSKRAADGADGAAQAHAREKAAITDLPAGTVQALKDERARVDEQRTTIVAAIAREEERRQTGIYLTGSLDSVNRQLQNTPSMQAVDRPVPRALELELQVNTSSAANDQLMHALHVAKDTLIAEGRRIVELKGKLEQCDRRPWVLALQHWESLRSVEIPTESQAVWELLGVLIETNAEAEVAAHGRYQTNLETLKLVLPDRQAAVDKAQGEWDLAKHARTKLELDLRAARWYELDAERIRLEGEIQTHEAGGAGVDVATLQQQREALAARLTACDAQLELKQRYGVLEQQLADATSTAATERVTHEAAKRLAEAIRVVRDEYLGELINPLLERMHGVLDKVRPGHVPYCHLVDDRGTADFDFGWMVDGKRTISFDTMSGGERVIFKVCLQYALIVLADPPLKLLLVDACEVDVPNLEWLLRALEKLECSNILVTTWIFPNKRLVPDDTWRVISMTDTCAPARTPEPVGA